VHGMEQTTTTTSSTETPRARVGRRGGRKVAAVALTLVAAGALAIGTTQQAAPASADTGTAMPVGDVVQNGRTLHQSYAEDFNTPANYGEVQWKYPQIATYNGERDTSGQGIYAPDKVLSVSNGNLDFWLHSENGQPLVATVMPDGYEGITTGRVSMRYKTTKTVGYKFVGMLWPVSDIWGEGEIDWPEGDLGSTVRPASAVPWSNLSGAMKFLPEQQMFAPQDQSEYHVVTTEWDYDHVSFYQDGQLVASTTTAVPWTPMRATLQAETYINQGAVPTSSDGHVDVDWISIWK